LLCFAHGMISLHSIILNLDQDVKAALLLPQ
jgi:hypothetical protein